MHGSSEPDRNEERPTSGCGHAGPGAREAQEGSRDLTDAHRRIRAHLALAVVVALCVCASAQARLSPERLRELVYRTHPCLAQIIDWEHSGWDPTVDYGGGHGNTRESYGLPQGNPGSKMARYSYTNSGHKAGDPTGPDWATNPWTQLRWMINYSIGRYGSECLARDYRRAHGSY